MRRSRLDLKLFEFSTSHQISLHVGSPGPWITPPVGFHNLVAVSDLQRHGWTGDYHAARSYSWIRPPKTFRRRVFAVVRSVTAIVVMSL